MRHGSNFNVGLVSLDDSSSFYADVQSLPNSFDDQVAFGNITTTTKVLDHITLQTSSTLDLKNMVLKVTLFEKDKGIASGQFAGEFLFLE